MARNFTNRAETKSRSKNVLLIRNRLSHIYYHKKFFDYPVSLSMKTIRNLGIGTTFVAGMSYIKSKILPKKETNLENFYINRFGKKLYEMFFKGYTEKLWGRSPNLIAADWGSQRVKGLSITKVISSALKKTFHIKEKNTETSLIEKFYYPKYGPGQMWECMKKQIIRSGGTILSDTTVTKIHRQGKKVKSITALQNGRMKVEEFMDMYHFDYYAVEEDDYLYQMVFKDNEKYEMLAKTTWKDEEVYLYRQI